MLPFVGVGLAVAEKMEIHDDAGKKAVMRFAKMYPPEKMGRIVDQAQKFWWWRNHPTAAFMKAVGVINHDDKQKKAEEAINQRPAEEQAPVGNQELG